MYETNSSLNIPTKYIDVDRYQVHFAEVGNGPAVLFVHGMGGSLQDWSENIDALSPAFRLHVLDLPGFGMSPVPPSDIEFNLGYAAGFVRALADRLGLERPFLIGNSMGGGICLKFAIDYPERTAGLVLANAVGLGREMVWSLRVLSLPGSARLALRFATKQTVRAMWQSMFADPAYATDERVEPTWQWFQRPGTRQFLEGIYRNGVTFRGQKDLVVPDLAGIKAPTLIVWGASDQILPASHAHRANELIQNSILHVLPDCGHIPQIEKSTDFNRLTREFLMSIVGQ